MLDCSLSADRDEERERVDGGRPRPCPPWSAICGTRVPPQPLRIVYEVMTKQCVQGAPEIKPARLFGSFFSFTVSSMVGRMHHNPDST